MISYISFRCFSSDSSASFNQKLADLASFCALHVSFFFNSLAHVLTLNLKRVNWNSENRIHLENAPPFWLKPFPLFSDQASFPEAFQALLAIYKDLQGITDRDLKNHLNQKLKTGFCHAECLMLVKEIQKNHSSLKEEVPKLSSLRKELLILQIIEIFRECFQKNGRADLIKKNEAFLPSHFKKEICYRSDDREINLENGLIVVRLPKEEHSLLIEVNPEIERYAFYNGASGSFSYKNRSDLIEAFLGHIKSNRSFIETDLSFSYYPL